MLGTRERYYGVLGILAAQVLLLVWALTQNRHQLNPDGIAYLRLAGYYAEGPHHLAVSGYWGPLLSWMIAVGLKLGLDPLGAARAAMALSAIGYGVGCLVLLQTLGLPATACRAGFGLAALATVAWSVEYTSPDLLVAGLICLATAATVRPAWTAGWRPPLLAGALWGTAYYAKAVALPYGLGVVLLVVGLRGLLDRAAIRAALRGGALSLLACGLVVSPWIATLSAKYGAFTVSTSAGAAHAVVGPEDVDRYHPYARTFHHPEPGRLTAWEDPTSLPYAAWSPFASTRNFRHQLTVAAHNAVTVWQLLGQFDLLHLGVLSATGVLLGWIAGRGKRTVRAGKPRPANRVSPAGPAFAEAGNPAPDSTGRLPFALLVPLLLAGLGGVYLPAYLGLVDQRYFYAALPLLFGAAARAAAWLRGWLIPRSPGLARVLGPLLLISFGAPALLNAGLSLGGLPNPAAQLARVLADRIQQAGRAGPVAGSGMILGNRTGLFTAWYLGEPWLGDEIDATSEGFHASGARWILVAARRPVTAQLNQDRRFRDRTPEWLDARTAGNPPIRVFEVVE
ncbi:MAG: hypothetical protein H7A47_14570 [Verrucomicrobiales bacterium]|nr:hypothetical protein [Verrucomicrobiales bacterium]